MKANPQASAYDNTTYRNFVLVLLLLVYMFNFVDRQLIVILQESIKQEMGFSDTQLGIMSGFAFAMLYATLGIPIARWADRGNRRNIVALSLGVWSLMTALCGMAQNFVQMLFARMGVAVGEAGGTPPAISMISDMYSEERRATAMSVYSSGIYFGMLAGFVLGGWLGQTYGWRMAFIVIGLPGVVFAIILRMVVKEPIRKLTANQPSQATQSHETIFDTLRKLWNNHTFRCTALAGAMASFGSYGFGNWLPSYLLREFDISIAAVGAGLGFAAGIGGVVGTVGGGLLVDHLVKRDRRWFVWLGASVVAAASLIGVALVLVRDPKVAIFIGLFSTAFNSAYLPGVLALVAGLVVSENRAQATAVLFFIMNIIGMGLGPMCTGLLSDAIPLTEGGDSLRIAMITVGGIGAWSAIYLFYRAGRSLIQDMDAVST